MTSELYAHHDKPFHYYIYIMYKCIGGLNIRMQMRLQKEVENIRYDRHN